MEQLENPDRELNYRKTMGVVVRLMLKADTTDQVYVTYEHGNDYFAADVPPEKAAHAFIHPNIYREDDAPKREAVFAVPEGYKETRG